MSLCRNETPQVKTIDFLTGTHAGVANLSKNVRPVTPPTVTRLMTKTGQQ
jgi:hypothetical protein